MLTRTEHHLRLPLEWGMGTCHLGEVGRSIRHLCPLRNLSERDLSQERGLSVGSLSRIERGLSSFSIPSLRAICGALDGSPADMLGVAERPGQAFSGDPLADVSALRRVSWVMKGGEVVPRSPEWEPRPISPFEPPG